MNRAPVESSNIKSIGHDSAANIMEVEFHNGGIYQYHGVSADHHANLINADSIGSHFHKNIKNNFKFSKIS